MVRLLADFFILLLLLLLNLTVLCVWIKVQVNANFQFRLHCVWIIKNISYLHNAFYISLPCDAMPFHDHAMPYALLCRMPAHARYLSIQSSQTGFTYGRRCVMFAAFVYIYVCVYELQLNALQLFPFFSESGQEYGNRFKNRQHLNGKQVCHNSITINESHMLTHQWIPVYQKHKRT